MKENVILFFNKVSKQFGGMIRATEDTVLSDEYFIYKEVILDLEKETWEGNYDSGQVVPIDSFKDKPIITEYMLNGQCSQKIERQYPAHKQLNIMSDLLEVLLAKAEFNNPDLKGKSEVEAFKDMIEYIRHTRENNHRWKASYENSDSHIYSSADEIENYITNELDGGVRNVVGRPIKKPETPWRRDY
jgi:hypothetical protein